MLFTCLLSLLPILPSALAIPAQRVDWHNPQDIARPSTNWPIQDNYSPADLLNWYIGDSKDETGGNTNYVNSDTAKSRNMVAVEGDALILRSAPPSNDEASRDSVRLLSPKTYGRDFVAVFDVSHMPYGRGVFPALWTLHQQEAGEEAWPWGGEIDVLEGSGVRTENQVTLHTKDTCSVNTNQGRRECPGGHYCGIRAGANNAYGQAFNDNQGGQYVLVRRSGGVWVYFVPRNDATTFTISDDLVDANDVQYRLRKYLQASFESTDACNLDDQVASQTIIMNIAFCGSLGQDGFSSNAECISTMRGMSDDDVKEMYFAIRGVKTYTPNW